MKTAKEFFEEESKRQWLNSTNGFSSDPDAICRIPYVIYPKVFKVMDDYANQQLAEYKTELKEWINNLFLQDTLDEWHIGVAHAYKTVLKKLE